MPMRSCRKNTGPRSPSVIAKELPRPDGKPADHTKKVKVFILLGHWLEMRARSGASQAIQTLEGEAGVALIERSRGHLEARRSELAGGAAQHPGARVLGAVDAVAEAHDPLVPLEQVHGVHAPGDPPLALGLPVQGRQRVEVVPDALL